jgi:hypothetical protein
MGNGQIRIAFDFMVTKQLKKPIPNDDFAIPRPLQQAMIAHPEDSRKEEKTPSLGSFKLRCCFLYACQGKRLESQLINVMRGDTSIPEAAPQL